MTTDWVGELFSPLVDEEQRAAVDLDDAGSG
jgi:hypothetical protein